MGLMKFGNWPCRKTSALLFALESIHPYDETLSKRDFTTHMKDIHTPRVYMCDQCDYTAAREEYLKKHIKFTHDGEVLEKAAALGGYRIHQCNFRDHIFNKMSNIKQHLKGGEKNVSEKTQNCSDCEFHQIQK